MVITHPILTHLIFINSKQGHYFYYLHLTDKNTEPKITHPEGKRAGNKIQTFQYYRNTLHVYAKLSLMETR